MYYNKSWKIKIFNIFSHVKKKTSLNMIFDYLLYIIIKLFIINYSKLL